MISYNDTLKENLKQHNPNWPKLLDHPYKIIITGCSRGRKTNILFNLIKQQNDDDYIIDIIYLYVKDPNEVKYQYLIKKTRKSLA